MFNFCENFAKSTANFFRPANIYYPAVAEL